MISCPNCNHWVILVMFLVMVHTKSSMCVRQDILFFSKDMYNFLEIPLCVFHPWKKLVYVFSFKFCSRLFYLWNLICIFVTCTHLQIKICICSFAFYFFKILFWINVVIKIISTIFVFFLLYKCILFTQLWL